MIEEQELKVRNTKSLLKKVLLVGLVISTYEFILLDRSVPFVASSNNSVLMKETSLSDVSADKAPLALTLTWSLNVDLGEELNSLVRSVISLR